MPECLSIHGGNTTAGRHQSTRRRAGAAFLGDFREDAKASGLQHLIIPRQIRCLSVAPAS
jgi:hypothetical protein